MKRMKPMSRNRPAFHTLSHEDLTRTADTPVSWLWHGYLARGDISLLTGQWKCGKTPLLSALLGRLGTGGVLAGLPLAAGKAVVVTEESPQHWNRRGSPFGFGPHLWWLCRPFRAKPTPEEWLALIDHLWAMRREHGI